MSYLEKIQRKDKTYYYITKNFRLDTRKWKKIRKYIGSAPPTEEEREKAIIDIEKEALHSGLTKESSKYKYLDNEMAEKLQDLKDVFNGWYGTIGTIDREKFDDDFIVRFTYNSNAIEGNRLSLRETSMILTEHIIPAGATPNDYNETINSRDTYEFIKTYTGEFNQNFLLKVHKELTKNTRCEIVGNYRDHDVRISGSEWIPPSHKNIKEEMKTIFQWYYSFKKKLHPLRYTSLFRLRLHSQMALLQKTESHHQLQDLE